MQSFSRRLHLVLLVTTVTLSICGAGLWFYSYSVSIVTGSDEREYWLYKGEVGAGWTEKLPLSELSCSPEELTLEYNNTVQTLTLPTTLWEVGLPGIGVHKRETLVEEDAIVIRSLSVRISIWLLVLLFALYSLVTIGMGPLPRYTRRAGWRRALGWIVVISSIGTTAFFGLAALLIPDADTGAIIVVVFFSAIPGAMGLAGLLPKKKAGCH